MAKRRLPQVKVGQRYGQWTVLEAGCSSGAKRYRAKCLCECGAVEHVYHYSLLYGASIRCKGCWMRLSAKATSARNFKHGNSCKAEYFVYHGMLSRCYDQLAVGFANYGGRGITVCAKWRDSLQAFLTDMGPRPTPAHTLDRLNNDGNYEPGNCQWATRYEQARNRRSNVKLTLNGETLILKDWAKRFNVPAKLVRNRINRGCDLMWALTSPPRKGTPL